MENVKHLQVVDILFQFCVGSSDGQEWGDY